MNNYRLLKKTLLSTVIVNVIGVSSVFANAAGTITGDRINVRAGNSRESQIVGQLNSNAKIVITGMADDWYEIDYNGRTAYVINEFVKITETDGIVNGNDINVRKGPSLDSEIIGRLNLDDHVTVKGTSGEFLLITYNGQPAYVHTDFVNAEVSDFIPAVSTYNDNTTNEETLYASVTSPNGLNFRISPSIEADIIGVFEFNDAIDVLEIDEGWIKVKTDDDTVGYVNSEFVTIQRGVKPGKSQHSKATEIIDFAKNYLGTPYKWAGTNLRTGVDCSGFVYSVMRNFGVYLNRTSRDMVHNGTKVSKSNLQPGDLVFFDTNSNNNGQISHVGIYMGDGKFIHSSSAKNTWGVTISSLNEAYYTRTYVTAARVL